MKPPTDGEIKKEVYVNTFQETSIAIESFINGMIFMRDKWLESIDDDVWIYERDGRDIYKRPRGSDEQRTFIKTITDENIINGD